jgi:hypothetical protein
MCNCEDINRRDFNKAAIASALPVPMLDVKKVCTGGCRWVRMGDGSGAAWWFQDPTTKCVSGCVCDSPNVDARYYAYGTKVFTLCHIGPAITIDPCEGSAEWQSHYDQYGRLFWALKSNTCAAGCTPERPNFDPPNLSIVTTNCVPAPPI